MRRNYQTYGAEGLLDRLPGGRGPHPNRVSEEVEKASLDYSLQYPTHGCLPVAQALVLQGVQVSAGGVRGMWSRHTLMTKIERLLRLEQSVAERKIQLTPEQIRLLERFSPEFRERHIEQHRAAITTVLSDNGREFCGRPDRHAYELYLQLQGIEHRRTTVGRPQTNGFIERFHRTLLDEHFPPQGPGEETLGEMQEDLDVYLVVYNTKRPH